MAKRGAKTLRARKNPAASRDDDSLLIKSAESLGRVIGSLQRQVQNGTRRVTTLAAEAREALPDLPRVDTLLGARARKRVRATAGARAAAPAKAPGARAAARAKAPAARAATAARKRAGARKTSGKKR